MNAKTMTIMSALWIMAYMVGFFLGEDSVSLMICLLISSMYIIGSAIVQRLDNGN